MSVDRSIHVVAAVLFDSAGRVLLSRRPDHAHLGGLWEFPGGKVEVGEEPKQALRRELQEELGVELTCARPLIQVPYQYPEKAVLLDVWCVSTYDGLPEGVEGQELVWVTPLELREWAMPPADRPIIDAIRLPDRYLVTPDPQRERVFFLERLQRVLERGVRLVQLRAKSLSETAYCELAQDVLVICRRFDSKLLLNQTPRLVEDLGADGVHLSSARMGEYRKRPLPEQYLVAASCHSMQELDYAAQLGVDFAVLGPVNPTASHPDSIPLGWAQFRAWANSVAMPVYALGGMRLADIIECQLNGAQGIAAISGLWGDVASGD